MYNWRSLAQLILFPAHLPAVELTGCRPLHFTRHAAGLDYVKDPTVFGLYPAAAATTTTTATNYYYHQYSKPWGGGLN